MLLARVPPGVGALPGALVLLGEGVEDLVKILRLGGPRQLSKQNVVGADVLTIKLSIGFFPFNQTAAFQGDASKEAPGLAVGEDGRRAPQGQVPLQVPSQGPHCHGEVPSERQVPALRKRFHCSVIVQDDHQV